MDWRLYMYAHWPHDRFLIGWEFIGPTEDDQRSTFSLYLGIFTFNLDVHH